MSIQKKILILCGGKFAFKAIELLAFEHYLCGIGIGKSSSIYIEALEKESENNNLDFKSFPNKNSISEMKSWLENLKPDFIFSINFPFLIPEDVLSYGKEKFINFHPGPLPYYRGAMPIFEVLKNQDKLTAISVHFMNSKFDEGPIIFEEPVKIDKNDTYGKLAIKLSNYTAQIALNMANMVQYANEIPSSKQDLRDAYYYEKPELNDTCIKWKSMDSEEIIALVNSCNPWNIGADTSFEGTHIKIIIASIYNQSHQNTTPGTILRITEDKNIAVACSDDKQILIEVLKTDYGIINAKQFNYQKNILGKKFI
ncbi:MULTISPECIES: methionyl-tRNA formyltransferase [unclassified Flavobacterium]|uniref:methionyl-tRNA formyltransferase n=1 Tax=unclassified Flavobacterium TaxID=196869 RepID=UPI001291BC7D|nr:MULTISPECIES: formyltransferase family protein [unclassified Flavobacterium]MQP52203.1 methionyl-tRNA formyltransferase [Flavobacterium sp. LMO9]MQP62073.1 methionyl-tRNA formyltransferase [Flavobacterium sp. LMO6]